MSNPLSEKSLKLVLTGLLSITFLSGCSSINPEHFNGENLVVPFVKDLKNWQLFQTEEMGVRSNMWQKPGERWADTYAVSIYADVQADLDAKRMEMDAPGLESCERFSSTLLEHPHIQTYDYLFWETECKIQGKVVAKVIHLMIQGTDSFYQIQKAWRAGFSQQEAAEWRTRFVDTFVCDNRNTDTLCPPPD